MKYLLLLGLLLLPSVAMPDIVEDMEVSGFTAYKAKKELNEKKWGERIQHTYDRLVKFGVFRLKKAKYLNADQFAKEWKALYSKEFIYNEIGLDRVEDHEPALKWLDNFYQTLVKHVGLKAIESMRLNDIDLLNRSILVTFHPKGTEHDDYKDCFVRGTAEPVGYWSVMAACSIYDAWLGTSPAVALCGPLSLAGRLSFGIVGGPLSESIWKGANP